MIDEEMGDGMRVNTFCPECGRSFDYCVCEGDYDDEDYEEYE